MKVMNTSINPMRFENQICSQNKAVETECTTCDTYDDLVMDKEPTYKEFAKDMALKDHGFSDKELKHIEKLFNEVAKLDKVGKHDDADKLWNKMMDVISEKVDLTMFDEISDSEVAELMDREMIEAEEVCFEETCAGQHVFEIIETFDSVDATDEDEIHNQTEMAAIIDTDDLIDDAMNLLSDLDINDKDIT